MKIEEKNMNGSCQTRRMFGHNYALPGTYEVTMVVAARRPVFGKIVGTTKAGGEAPHIELSPLGEAVLNDEIPKIHRYYPMVDIWQLCLMPDHIHMIVRINRPLPEGKHLGIIIGAFKGGVSRAWWRLTGATEANAPVTVANTTATSQQGMAGGATAASGQGMAGGATATSQQGMAGGATATSQQGMAGGATAASGQGMAGGATATSQQGMAGGATVSGASAPGFASRAALFEPNYNDHILMRDGQLDNWKRYLRDNPRRYMMCHEHPDLFRRSLCIVIDGIRYSAFGNMLLLRQPEKHQVFFHRKTDGMPTEQTRFWDTERQRLLSAAMSGDVLVTPGISECEKRIKNLALANGLRLIHVQSEPIGRYWKPERSRFEACAAGSLLILAPWPEDLPPFVSDYERFHYLNRLAETACSIGHTTSVAVKELWQGSSLDHGG